MNYSERNPSAKPGSDGNPHPGVGLRWVFHIYKAIVSPILHAVSPSRCLYLPTCSEYAYVALRRFGIVRGGWMAVRRFARCHPFAQGGFDPVPEMRPCGAAASATGNDRLP
jgi:putative membrane protein insertion efficiency factor